MTTYLGEKAVGIGTVKANMNVGKVITDEKTILGDGFTEQLAVNTLLFATSESVAASAEAVRTEFDGRLKAVEGEITNVEDDVRELRKGTHDELVDIKLDVSDLKDADQNIRTEMAGLQTQVTAQIAGKQDKLTPGENITIEDGVISATGGGGGASLPDQTDNAGKFLTTDGTNVSWGNAIANVSPVENGIAIGKNQTITGSGISIGNNITLDQDSYPGRTIAIGNYSSATKAGAAFGHHADARGLASLAIGHGTETGKLADYAIQLGSNGVNNDANTFKVGNANGNFEMMSADGTIPLERLTKVTDQIGDISTALTAILGE